VPASRSSICSLFLKLHTTLPSKSRCTSSSDSWRGGRAPLAEITPPPGRIRAGPPADWLKSSQRFTTLPFMSITITACVASGDSTV
jgi:hypothetical protein